MRSEEENYQLKITNSALLKEVEGKKQAGSQAEKEGEERLVSELISKIHKGENEISKLNQVVCQLEEDNYSLKEQLKSLKESHEQEKQDKEEMGSPSFISRIVDSLFNISNNIPET